MDFENHDDVLKGLGEAQDAQEDTREEVREQKLFVMKRDGQWEPEWWNQSSGKPRYTFDMTSPVIDQIAGEMSKADFDIRVSPAGGEASKETAKVIDGMIRNIENISNATHIFNTAGRSMITSGLDGWRVNTRYVDDNSFDQDLVIETIPDFADRVWLDPGATLQDGSDAMWGVVMTGILKTEYERRYPDKTPQSLHDGRQDEVYYYTPDMTLIGELLYIKEVERELVLMSNGQVFVKDDDFALIEDELAAVGVTVEKTRKRMDRICYSRDFDNGGWLSEERETVFSWVPLIPTYGNFAHYQNKTTYHGVVRPMMDYQMVYNYIESRQIEEGALSPRAKYWMTPKQAAGHEDSLATMNTNSDPVQFYNHDPENPGPPQQNGGAAVNQGLAVTAQSMAQGMMRAAGFAAPDAMSQVSSNTSGVAIKELQNKGDIGTIKFFESQEIAICHTARILIDSLSKVYDAERQVRVLGEDGSTSMAIINQQVQDQQTGQIVKLNDLSMGKYDVVCSSGPSFQNRQQETVSAMVEAASVSPEIMQIGNDVFASNVTAPGFDLVADRLRRMNFQQGIIPFEQMTDEEKQEFQQMQQQQAEQGQQPDAMMVAAQAEMAKAEAEMQKTQIASEKNQIEGMKAQIKAQYDNQMLQLQLQKQEIELAEKSQKANLEQEQFDFNSFMAMQQQQAAQQKQQMDMLTQVVDDRNTMADTLKKLREAMGVDAMVGPQIAMAVEGEASDLLDAQE